MWQTNGGEIAAFFLARAIAVALYYVANSMFLGALFVRSYQVGGRAGMVVVSVAASLVSWLITLLLLVLFRAGLGSVPPAVAVDRRAVTTSGGEFGAFILAFVAITMLLSALSTLVLTGFYQGLRTSGHAGLVTPIALGVSTVGAVVFLVIFIALRGAMAGPTPAQGTRFQG